jgi:ABC-type bacteriocin/lantibiotic exporter with double-glycine peptidase domain
MAILNTKNALLNRIITMIATVIMVLTGLMFSAVLLAVFTTVGTIGLSYFWWKTRAIRAQLREQMSQQAENPQVFNGEAFKGELIEGEVIRKDIFIE